MSNLGDIITSLSTNTPLVGTTGTFLSDPYLISEYNSISFIMKSDIDTIVQLQWSADGVNYYYKQNFTFLASISDQGVASIASKWLRVQISNKQGVTGSTFMSFQLYASPGSDAVSAIIKGVTANILAEIDVRNSFAYSSTGELMAESFVPDQQYSFNYSSVTPTNPGSTVVSTYNNVFGTSRNLIDGGNTKEPFAHNQVSANSYGALQLIDWGGITGATGNGNAQSMIYSTQFTKWLPGYGMSCIFNAGFYSGFYDNNLITSSDMMLVGMGNLDNSDPQNPYDGIFMGFTGVTGGVVGSGPGANVNQYFGIHIYRYGTLYDFIPQTSWSDPCNGDFKMPSNMNWANINTFKLQILPQGDLNVFILNPSTGIFNLVYYRSFVNVSNIGLQSTFNDPSFQMISLFRSTAGANPPVNTNTNNGLFITSWMIGFENSFPNYKIDRYNPNMYFKTIVSGSAPKDVVCYYLQNGPTLNGNTNHTTLYLDDISIAMIGTNNIGILGLYKNPTFLTATGGTGGLISRQIDPYNSPAILFGLWGATGANGGLPTINGSFPSTSGTGTNIPLFSTILPNAISQSAGNFATGQQIDISSYNIKMYPNDSIALIISSNNSLSGTETLASLGFHQLH